MNVNSEYRFAIDEHDGIAYLCVLTDPGRDIPGSPYLVSTYISLDALQQAIERYEKQKCKVDPSVWEI